MRPILSAGSQPRAVVILLEVTIVQTSPALITTGDAITDDAGLGITDDGFVTVLV
jgi:hypothetical protein